MIPAGVGGIHHVTAIASDPQRNLDFYAGLLGLRLVKRTVNFDDPGTYHFYFGDKTGSPGSLLTFFPWPGAHRGRPGPGQVAVCSFAILPGSIGFWIERMVRYAVRYEGPEIRYIGSDEPERVISFKDPDGMLLELVGTNAARERPGWLEAPGISAENAIRGFHSVTLWVEHNEETVETLIDTLGFRRSGEAGSTLLLSAGEGGPGAMVQVRTTGGFVPGVSGAGTIHHVAWRVPDAETQLLMRSRVALAGLEPTPVIDRAYFHSVYFREPSGVLYELATISPGFAIDEPVERLGQRLMLPPQYEPHRSRIEAALPKVHLPGPLSESSFLAAGS
ncbi:MAG TPA: ring-cleaving dioxygenase [Gemmatimonadales bacterium]|nr:ring-cleaving dioxygenase [Gemmatimonadales bacterium]